MMVTVKQHLFVHCDTMLEDCCVLKKLIKAAASSNSTTKYYFFIGEDHNVSDDLIRRDKLFEMIKREKNITIVIEKGMKLSGANSPVYEEDMLLGILQRNYNLAKKPFIHNAEYGNKVTVYFCGSDHDDKVRSELITLYNFYAKTLQTIGWISVGSTPKFSPKRLAEMQAMAGKALVMHPVGFLVANQMSEVDCDAMYRRVSHVERTLQITSAGAVRLVALKNSNIYKVLVKNKAESETILESFVSGLDSYRMKFVWNGGETNYAIFKVDYDALPQVDIEL